MASINLDNSFPYGRTSDVINFGDGRSELDDVVREIVATQRRRVVPDPFPSEGFYFRMDHFEFANVGIPAITPAMGIEVTEKPAGFGRAKVEEYLQRDYHQATDEVRPDWNYGGAVQDAQMDFLIGLRVAEGERWPSWKPGAEFKPRREAMPTEPAGSATRCPSRWPRLRGSRCTTSRSHVRRVGLRGADAPGDVEGDVELLVSTREKRVGRRHLVPVATVKAGKLVTAYWQKRDE